MSPRTSAAAILVAITLAAFTFPASGGEIGGGIGGCAISGYRSFGCDWKPTTCSKPYVPSIMAFDTYGYNLAVEQFNQYLREVETYISCAVRDGKSDVSANFPAMVQAGIDKQISELQSEIDNLRSNLDSARSALRR